MRIDLLKPAPPPEPGDAPKPLASRLAWFVGLSTASALVVVIAAYLLRGVLFL